MEPSNLNNIPFQGFDLKRSTSFSPEHDEAASAEFEDHQIENVPQNLQQRQIAASYNETEQGIMRRSAFGNVYPLERKPAVFENSGKLNVISDHIEEIKDQLEKNF